MKNKRLRKKYAYMEDMDNLDLAQEFVWGSNDEARREGQSLYLIHAIAAKHEGDAKVDLKNHFIEINVPDDKKASCLEEIEEKTGLVFH